MRLDILETFSQRKKRAFHGFKYGIVARQVDPSKHS